MKQILGQIVSLRTKLLNMADEFQKLGKVGFAGDCRGAELTLQEIQRRLKITARESEQQLPYGTEEHTTQKHNPDHVEMLDKLLATFSIRRMQNNDVKKPYWGGNSQVMWFGEEGTEIHLFHPHERLMEHGFFYGVHEIDTDWVIQPCNLERLIKYLTDERQRESRKRGI